MAQRDELAQPSELRASEVAHVGEVFAVTDHGAEGDEQHFGQWVKHAPDNARVGQGGKELFEPQTPYSVAHFRRKPWTRDMQWRLCGKSAGAKITMLRQRDRFAHRSPQQAQQKQNHPS